MAAISRIATSGPLFFETSDHCGWSGFNKNIHPGIKGKRRRKTTNLPQPVAKVLISSSPVTVFLR